MKKFNPNDPVWVLRDRVGNPTKIPGIFIKYIDILMHTYNNCKVEVFGIPNPHNLGPAWVMSDKIIIPRDEPPPSWEEVENITEFSPEDTKVLIER